MPRQAVARGSPPMLGVHSNPFGSIRCMKKQSLIERLRAKKGAHSTVLGVTWYSAENWSRIKATAVDPERFEATFAEWQAMAHEALTDMRKGGVEPIKVSITYEELLPWCLVHKKPNNAASRAEFVSQKLRKDHEAPTEPNV